MTLSPRLFCDTSFFFACLDPRDVNHRRALELVEQAAAARSDLTTTWDIISETVTLLRYRLSYAAAWTFLSEVKPTLRLVHYSDSVRAEAEEVFRLYGRGTSALFLRRDLLRGRHDGAWRASLPRFRPGLSGSGPHCDRLESVTSEER